MTRTIKATENGQYEGTFRWGRSGEADVSAVLRKNDHGWFCDSVNGQEWDYPAPLDPFGGWGAQVAKDTPLEALRGFLRQWNANGGHDCDPGQVSTAADRLAIRPVAEA